MLFLTLGFFGFGYCVCWAVDRLICLLNYRRNRQGIVRGSLCFVRYWCFADIIKQICSLLLSLEVIECAFISSRDRLEVSLFFLKS